MGETIQHRGLILAPIEPEHWVKGSGKATQTFGGALNPSGDWTPYKASDELQSQFGLETMACVVFSSCKAWISLANLLGFKDFPPDVSERYAGTEGGTTPEGTDPHVWAEKIRTTFGLIPQAVMPWTSDITTLDAYFNKTMADSLISLGKALLGKFVFGHEWVFAWGASYTPAQKESEIQDALTRGPVCVSVHAWETDSNGLYTKTPGEYDNHWVQLLRYDGDKPVIHDNYAPFIKTLAPGYDFQAAKVYFLKRNVNPAKSFWQTIWSIFAAKVSSETPVTQTPMTYDFSTQKNAYHSTRVICDEEGLTVDQKNLICACIYQESTFLNTAKLQNKDKTGAVWSTDWGICQINDYWHIGSGKDFPTVDYVLDNPDKVVRFMIAMYKKGQLKQWVSYSSGAYLKWLRVTSPMWNLKS